MLHVNVSSLGVTEVMSQRLTEQNVPLSFESLIDSVSIF